MSGPNTLCGGCHDRIEAALGRPATAAELGRAALFGVGAAVAGGVAWYGIREATGSEFGILAIGLAWGIAWAVRKGGGGGVPQQIFATGLTYVAIVGSYYPSLYADIAADGTTGPVLAALSALVAVVALPVFIGVGGGDFFWFIIVGIALWSAFRRTARQSVSWTGPFETAAPTPA